VLPKSRGDFSGKRAWTSSKPMSHTIHLPLDLYGNMPKR
jgi:hypothetical protein